MPPPINAEKTGGRLSGPDMCNYLESFADRYLKGTIRFQTEVLNIRRGSTGGWLVEIQNKTSGIGETLKFSKIVLCTGVGCFSFNHECS